MQRIETQVPPFLRVIDGKAEMVVSINLNGEQVDAVAPIKCPSNWCRDTLVALVPLIEHKDDC